MKGRSKVWCIPPSVVNGREAGNTKEWRCTATSESPIATACTRKWHFLPSERVTDAREKQQLIESKSIPRPPGCSAMAVHRYA